MRPPRVPRGSACSRITSTPAFHDAVFMFYDYLLTFGREVDLFWLGPRSGATYLYFANRYLTLTVRLLNYFSLIPGMSDKVRTSHFAVYMHRD